MSVRCKKGVIRTGDDGNNGESSTDGSVDVDLTKDLFLPFIGDVKINQHLSL